MTLDFKKEEEVKDYLQNLEVQYTFGCHKENNPEACHLLGDFMEAVKKNFEGAAKCYKMACDNSNFARSCHMYGNYLMLGKGVEKSDKMEAYRYYSKGCELENAESCCNAGLMLMSEDAEISHIQSIPRGMGLLKAACEAGSQHACYFLSGIYISGSKDKSIEKDMDQAAKYSRLSCDLENMYACANLSIMYKKGDGVEKNQDLSDQFKKKAAELQQQHNDQLLVNFQRGPDT